MSIATKYDMSFYNAFLLTEYKHHNDRSMRCGHCGFVLRFKQITSNPSHVYVIGTRFTCLCGKSSVWTNSIRGDHAFLPNFEKPDYTHYRGFCNDEFCGHCYDHLRVMKNGVRFTDITGEEKAYDRYGCAKCPENQNILIDAYDKDREGEATTNKLLNFYRGKAADVKKVAQDEV